MRLIKVFFLILFFSCNSNPSKNNDCNKFLECLDKSIWKLTTGTFSQYNIFYNNPEGIYMVQYEMFNRASTCKMFSFSTKDFSQNRLEMKSELLEGKVRFIWNINELYCVYNTNLRTENITFYKSSFEELEASLKNRSGCNLPNDL